MTIQKKLPSDIEENIQNLAGDIYLQIEDKITALLSNYGDNIEVTREIITAHPLYLELKEQQQFHQQQASKNQQDYSAQLATLQTEKTHQQVTLAQLQEELSNAKKLNSAKLTDSELMLEDTLAERSQLAKQVATLSQENIEQQQLLKEMGFEAESVNRQLKNLAKENESLAKNDKAKAATLAVQNQQYSALQLNFEQVSSELEYLKAEQEHELLASHEQLTHEQQQAEQLSEKMAALQAVLARQQAALDQQQETITSKNHENNDLTTKINTLAQTIAQLEKNEQIAQQQYETHKQELSSKWLNDQEKNAEKLKQTSDDNEQILKQIHVVERSKQALENELVNVNDELSAVNKQQLQVLDTVQTLEERVQKEQAVTANLGVEKTRLEAALAQAQQGYSREHAQQTQKITDLTKRLATIAIEHESAQQSITNLAQKSQAQTEQITLLVEQAENEQLKFQQAIDKKNQSHQEVVEGHQKYGADKAAALTELQQQADKAAQALSQQLSSQAELLTAESAKLTALQQLYDNTLKRLDKIEHDVSEKQQQLTAVQAELIADRSAAAKNRHLQQENKEKQEVQYNKARETIKYLRDENTELNRKLDQQVNELEDKLTEYRLRFDYAQKQLTKLSK